MTKKELEELRNENRQKLVEVYHKTAQFYEKFADIIKNGGILKDSDWGELNDTEFTHILYKDESISLTYLFSNTIEEEVE